jgi:hypothetical protein
MSIENFFGDKSYELSTLEVYSASGTVINFLTAMIELNIFEDIHSPTLSGNLVVADSEDQISSLPMIGFEFLRIIFSKPGNKPIELIFRIYKINNIELKLSLQSTQKYEIQFCSEELLISQGVVLSKSYKGKTPRDITFDILKNNLLVNDQKIFRLQDTPGNYDIILSGMRPLAAIEWAVAKSTTPFLFFENKRGFNLRGVNDMLTANEIARYGYAPQNAKLDEVLNRPNSEEIKLNMNNMAGFEFYSMFDVLKGINTGMFSSVISTLDLVRQKKEDYVMEYQKNFDTRKHVDTNNKSFGSFQNGFKDRTKKTVNEKYTSMRKFYPTTKDHNVDPIIAGKQPNIRPNMVENWMLQKITNMQQLEYFKVKFMAPGNPALNAGDVITFDMPRMMSKDNTPKSKEHPYHSGRYLITAIRHKIQYSNYEMIMEGVRDCVSQPYPLALNDNPAIDALRKS